MSLTWITSPQTGDIVGLSLSVTVQWNITREDKKPGPTSKSKAAAKAATVDPKIKLSASGTGISVTVDGNANSAEYSIGTDTSRTFTVICSDVPSSGDVTLTAELYDTTPAVVASDTESPTVQALLDLGGGFSHGLGGFAPLAKSAGGTKLVVAGFFHKAKVIAVDAVITCIEATPLSTEPITPKKKAKLLGGPSVGLNTTGTTGEWATVIHAKHKDPKANHQIQIIFKNDGDDVVLTTSAAIPRVAIEVPAHVLKGG